MRKTELVTVLRDRGLLLLSDNTLPSVATIVAGEPIRRSWWAHRKSHQIFRAATALAESGDVVALPLVSGKITFVHRRLWPALLAVGLAHEEWQTAGLPTAARRLLTRVEKHGQVQGSGTAVKALQRRLLVISREVHTATGAHAKILERWDRWAMREAVTPLGDAATARRTLEDAAAALGRRSTLPWT